jgi:hypothetical protein
MSRWSWWLASDAGLAARIAIGAGIFVILAAADLIRHGRKATRWREHAFLLAATALAMLYGVINDRIAAGISWEYFYYGKDLKQQLGPAVPPDATALNHAAIGVGLRATWTVGLLIGAILLIANNPRPNRRPVLYRSLLVLLILIGGIAACGAIAGGIIGSRGWLNWTNRDLAGIWRENLFRPRRFLAVYGMNLGGYAGGATGLACCALLIHRLRRIKIQPPAG